MALTNQERVGKAIEQLRDGLKPFVERELAAVHGAKWAQVADLGQERAPRRGDPLGDPQAVLGAIWFNWEQVFKRKLSQTERTLVSEPRDIRNRWAHHEAFSTDDAYRALDSAERLLKAVAAPQAAEVERQPKDLMRIRYGEDAKREVRKAATAPVEGQPQSGLKPWREVVTPHADIASGRYQQAEFAAHLAQVHRGEGSDEYRKYARPLSPPLGRRHRRPSGQLPGMEPILKEAGVSQPPKAKRAVFVGTAPSAADARKMPDGTLIRTMWGDLAWQLGGKTGYALVAQADKQGVSPGSDALRQLLLKAAPCLVLIDEWVAYVRLLYGKVDLAGGSFDSNLTFAQSLTEAARAVPKAVKAQAILDSRGASPRGNRNAVVFLAADKARLAALESAARFYLAWHSIEKDQKALNLDPFQVSQVQTKAKESDDTVRARIPEAYVWILIPEQERKKDAKGEPTTEVDPQGRVVWQNERLQPGPEAHGADRHRELPYAEVQGPRLRGGVMIGHSGGGSIVDGRSRARRQRLDAGPDRQVRAHVHGDGGVRPRHRGPAARAPRLRPRRPDGAAGRQVPAGGDGAAQEGAPRRRRARGDPRQAARAAGGRIGRDRARASRGLPGEARRVGRGYTSGVLPGTATSSGGSSFHSMCGGVRSSFEAFMTQSQLSARPV
jgi:hypothetical protein